MYFEQRTYIGDIPVEPGARVPEPSLDLSAAVKIVLQTHEGCPTSVG